MLGLLRGESALERLRARSRGRPGAAAIDAALDGGGALPTRSELERALLRIVDGAHLRARGPTPASTASRSTRCGRRSA